MARIGLDTNASSGSQPGRLRPLGIVTDGLGNYTCKGIDKVLTVGHRSASLGLLVLFVVGLAALVFRRRDVS